MIYNFLASSESEKTNHPKYVTKNENRLNKYQRKLSKNKKVLLI
ncbi:transposase (plasmid) [Borreliella burgdorferi Bol26]|nr:transposase [Borreliella burgdorferi Bol26]